MDKYIELHFHLDGAITTDIARKLALLQGITLPAKDGDELASLLSVPKSCKNLNDFLKCFDLPLSLMQTREGIREAVHLVQENIRQNGVIYAELRFAPQLHCRNGLTQRQAIEAALEGLALSGLPSNLILCCMRGAGDLQRQANMETVELAREFLVEHGGVVALDLAGAEALFPTADFADIFARAREYAVPFTIHAGEAAGADSVRAALEMGARRIGHGVRTWEDPEVIALVRDRRIPLEMCPTSNRLTCAVADMENYPLKRYLDMGIPVTVNTDDMAICRTTPAEEYQYLEKLCGLTADNKKKILQNAIHAAFTDQKTRDDLTRQIFGQTGCS